MINHCICVCVCTSVCVCTHRVCTHVHMYTSLSVCVYLTCSFPYILDTTCYNLLFLVGVFFFFFGSSHSNRCEVIAHCGFDLHFPDMEHLFIYMSDIVCLLWKNVSLVLLAIFSLDCFGCCCCIEWCEVFIYFGY